MLKHSTSFAPGESAKLPVWEVQSSAIKLADLVNATPRAMQRSADRIAQEEVASWNAHQVPRNAFKNVGEDAAE